MTVLNKMGPKTELVVPGYLKNLAKIEAFVTQAAVQAGLNEQAIFAVQMAVDEACTNIIRHAYCGEGKGPIRLICDCQPEGLQITIFDQGDSFDPAQVPDLNTQAPLEERQAGGMGLFFVNNLMDEVQFSFDTPGSNQLVLFKRREP